MVELENKGAWFFHPDLNSMFTREVQDFVKSMYSMGQTVLQNKEGHARDSERRERELFNPFSITIQSNVSCIELLLWAITEDTGTGYRVNTTSTEHRVTTPGTDYSVNRIRIERVNYSLFHRENFRSGLYFKIY